MARAARDIIYAEELYTLERHAEGIIQVRVLENKVIEVKNRLRLADLQVAFVREKMEKQGFAPGENDAKDFAERLRMKTLIHAPQLTSLDMDTITSFARYSASSSANATDRVLQEPVIKVDVSQWAHATVASEQPDAKSTQQDKGRHLSHEGHMIVESGETIPSHTYTLQLTHIDGP